MSDIMQLNPIRQPERARAVFSPKDFDLIRTAISHYLSEGEDRPDTDKKDLAEFAKLYHRLGRVS